MKLPYTFYHENVFATNDISYGYMGLIAHKIRYLFSWGTLREKISINSAACFAINSNKQFHTLIMMNIYIYVYESEENNKQPYKVFILGFSDILNKMKSKTIILHYII